MVLQASPDVGVHVACRTTLTHCCRRSFTTLRQATATSPRRHARMYPTPQAPACRASVWQVRQRWPALYHNSLRVYNHSPSNISDAVPSEGTMLHDAEWLLPPAELHAPSDPPVSEGGAAHGGSGGGHGDTKTVSAVSLPPISTGYLASHSASLELAALADGMLHGRGAADERFGPLPHDV